MKSGHLSGIAAMMTGAGFFAMMDACLRELTTSLPSLQIAFLRGAASLPLVISMALLQGRASDLVPVHWGMHLIRSGLILGVLVGFIAAVRYMSLADAYAIFLSAPLLVTILAGPLLKEKVDGRRWIAVCLGLGGVLLMLQPSGQATSTGRWLAFAAAIAYALSLITVRALAKSETTVSIVVTTLAITTAVTAVLSVPRWVSIPPDLWLWIGAIGITGTLGPYLVTEAFRRAPASVVAPFEYTALLWAMGFDMLIWGLYPNALTLIGGSIVVLSGVYLMLREHAVS